MCAVYACAVYASAFRVCALRAPREGVYFEG